MIPATAVAWGLNGVACGSHCRPVDLQQPAGGALGDTGKRLSKAGARGRICNVFGHLWHHQLHAIVAPPTARYTSLPRHAVLCDATHVMFALGGHRSGGPCHAKQGRGLPRRISAGLGAKCGVRIHGPTYMPHTYAL